MTNFQDIFKSSFLEKTTSFSLLDTVIALGLAFVLGLFIFLVYKKTFSGVMYSASFGVSLLAMTLVTTLIILAVTSNVVLSLGMVGALRLKNPKKLIVLDGKDDRLELAKKFGADMVINPFKEDVDKIVKDLTDGYGCDVYIEATGHPSSVLQGLKMIRKLGRFVEFSVFSHDVTCDWSIISDRKELDVLGAHLSPYVYPFVIEAIADGRLPTEGVVTHTLPLKDYDDGFKMMKKGDKSLKIMLVP